MNMCQLSNNFRRWWGRKKYQ